MDKLTLDDIKVEKKWIDEGLIDERWIEENQDDYDDLMDDFHMENIELLSRKDHIANRKRFIQSNKRMERKDIEPITPKERVQFHHDIILESNFLNHWVLDTNEPQRIIFNKTIDVLYNIQIFFNDVTNYFLPALSECRKVVAQIFTENYEELSRQKISNLLIKANEKHGFFSFLKKHEVFEVDYSEPLFLIVTHATLAEFYCLANQTDNTISCLMNSSFAYGLLLEKNTPIPQEKFEQFISEQNREKAKKRHSKTEPEKQQVYEVWSNGDPDKSGNRWKNYSVCARYLIKKGSNRDQSTLVRWISAYDQERII